MRAWIKHKLISLGAWPGPRAAGRSCIIMYHGIDRHERTDLNLRFFSAANFERHVAFFMRRYHVLSLEDLCAGRGMRKDKLNVAITFDDGYRNNLTYALPILETAGCPATFFVTGLNTIGEDILWADLLDICAPHISTASITFQGIEFRKGPNARFPELREHIKDSGFLGTAAFEDLKRTLLCASGVSLSEPGLQDYFRLMNDEEIAQASRSPFVTIGSHGMFHNNLGRIPITQALEELASSKAYLERITGATVSALGYPDGSYTPELALAAFDMGYTVQCAVNFQYTSDEHCRYIHDRLGVYPSLSIPIMDHTIASFSR